MSKIKEWRDKLVRKGLIRDDNVIPKKVKKKREQLTPAPQPEYILTEAQLQAIEKWKNTSLTKEYRSRVLPIHAEEWIISDKDYHIALEYFHLEARPYTQTPCSQSYSNCPIKISEAAIRKEVLDALGTRLNSWISAMEILDSKHPSPLRKGIIMAYRDVEEWERQMRKSLRGKP